MPMARWCRVSLAVAVLASMTFHLRSSSATATVVVRSSSSPEGSPSPSSPAAPPSGRAAGSSDGGAADDDNPILLNVGQGTTGTRFLSTVLKQKLGFGGIHQLTKLEPKKCLPGEASAGTRDYCNRTDAFVNRTKDEIRRQVRDPAMQFLMDTPYPMLAPFVVRCAQDARRGPIILLSKRDPAEWAAKRLSHTAPVCVDPDPARGLDWDACLRASPDPAAPFDRVFARGDRVGAERVERAYRASLATLEPMAHVVLDLFASGRRWSEGDVAEGLRRCGVLEEGDSDFGRRLRVPPRRGCEIVRDPADGSINVTYAS